MCSRFTASDAFTQDIQAVAIDRDGVVERVATLSEVPDQVSDDASGDTAVFSTGDVICETLRRVVDGRDLAMDLTVMAGDRRYRLDDFDQSIDSDCSTTGRTDFPALSGDGSQLAFMGSTAAIGRVGDARLDARASIFVSTGDQSPREILADVSDATGLRWAHGDQLLAFAGTLSGESGIWLMHADGSGLTRISTTAAHWMDVNPAGDRVVGIVGDDSTSEPLFTITVIPIDQSATP